MKTRWPLASLSQICAEIVDCVNKTAPTVSGSTPYKMIRTTNVRNGRIDTGNVRYVTEETFKIWARRGQPRFGDVILTREAPLGEVGMLRTSEPVFLGQRLVMYRADPSRLEQHFLLYSMLHPETKAQIQAFGSGATVEHMRVPDCGKIRIPLPELEVQKRISAVLSAYDEMIENNERRIQVLEEMARTIYHEWFVKFRFPGSESLTGGRPVDWELRPLSSVLDVNPRLSIDATSGHRFIPMTSISETGMHIGPTELRTRSNGAMFANGDTLLARITPCLENGKTAFVQFLDRGEVARGSTEFIVLRSRSLTPEFVYLLARSDAFRQHAITSMSGATGRQRVRNECFDSYLVAIPRSDLLTKFHELVAPMFRMSFKLYEQRQNLAETRDLLLPMLVSGEIDVSEMDIDASRIMS